MLKTIWHWILATPPQVKSRWLLRYGNPFVKDRVIVTGVKGGWVRYIDRNGDVSYYSIRVFRFEYEEILNDK